MDNVKWAWSTVDCVSLLHNFLTARELQKVALMKLKGNFI
jgi:hypothetical protein